MNSAWTVLLQCVNNDTCLPETREKKKEKENADTRKRESKHILYWIYVSFLSYRLDIIRK